MSGLSGESGRKASVLPIWWSSWTPGPSKGPLPGVARIAAGGSLAHLDEDPTSNSDAAEPGDALAVASPVWDSWLPAQVDSEESGQNYRPRTFDLAHSLTLTGNEVFEIAMAIENFRQSDFVGTQYFKVLKLASLRVPSGHHEERGLQVCGLAIPVFLGCSVDKMDYD